MLIRVDFEMFRVSIDFNFKNECHGQVTKITFSQTQPITKAIQLAKSAGAYVTTTASPNKTPEGISKIDYMKQLGADEVINYKETDWAEARGRPSINRSSQIKITLW